MAKRIFGVATFTPTAQADTTGLTNATYMGIGSATATATFSLNISEIYMGGQASASAVNIMQFARVSTLGATPGALAAPNSDGPMNTATQVLADVPKTYVSAGTAPQRCAATTAARLHLNFNAFGGIVRWQADAYSSWGITGTTINVSESNLSAFTGGNVGAIGAHIIYEPL